LGLYFLEDQTCIEFNEAEQLVHFMIDVVTKDLEGLGPTVHWHACHYGVERWEFSSLTPIFFNAPEAFMIGDATKIELAFQLYQIYWKNLPCPYGKACTQER